jgi:ribosome-binding ATPase YchF (GTP1/OBG family)
LSGKKSKEDAEKGAIEEAALLRISEELEKGGAARSVNLNADEAALVKSLCLLTMKPLVFAANVSEDDLADKGARNPYVKVETLMSRYILPETLMSSQKPL